MRLLLDAEDCLCKYEGVVCGAAGRVYESQEREMRTFHIVASHIY